ncbi:hypothetical protein [Agromyces sp. ZXT2-3]|uniref:hypothetical protein n=1 Tax=Agromyces sp. ZXT2-3 TaxID=3461152 RepID=UPI004054F04B
MSAALEAVETALIEWAVNLSRLSKPLKAQMVVDAWIAGLREAGVKADNARAWSRGTKWPKKLPLVIEMPCPYEHRTPDRHDFAKVWLLVEDDGWISLDPESPCVECSQSGLERWLLTCPRCLVGEESLEHWTPHDLGPDVAISDEGDEFEGGSYSPLSFVIRQFEQLSLLATAKWWVEHTAEASEEYGDVPLHRRQDAIESRVEWARRMLAQAPPRKARSSPGAPAEGWTQQSTRTWLDQHDIADALTSRGAWERAKAIAGHPPKNAIEAARRRSES